MSFEDIGVLILRMVGIVWIVGGGFLLRQLWANSQLDPMIAKLEQMAREMGAPPGEEKIDVDNGRERWMAVGAVVLVVAGVAMGLAHRAAVWLLAAVIVQQMAYFIRQRRRELRAPARDAFLERPSRQTINAFFFSLVMAVLAAWLYWRGALG